MAGCGRDAGPPKEYGYVSARQAFLRDRIAVVYNKVATVQNGDRVQVLERKRRFLRVRTDAGAEGWIEQRFVAGQDVYDALQQLARANAGLPAESTATARAALNMHVEPSRVSPAIYQLKEGDKMVVLKRAVTEKGAPATPALQKSDEAARQDEELNEQEEEAVEAAKGKKQEAPAAPAAPLEDWWLVRDTAGRYGWVLGRMIDIDVPLDVAQYAEGQRIIAGLVLDKVRDEAGGKDVPEYLVLLTDDRDGLPYDYNQVRVFSWNRRRGRYETAYRDRLQGFLPVTVGKEDLGKEGTLPTFTIRGKDDQGNIVSRKYQFNTPMVRLVTTPGEQPVRFARPLRSPQGGARNKAARRRIRR
jgi:SH3-like domain-containing protein